MIEPKYSPTFWCEACERFIRTFTAVFIQREVFFGDGSKTITFDQVSADDLRVRCPGCNQFVAREPR